MDIGRQLANLALVFGMCEEDAGHPTLTRWWFCLSDNHDLFYITVTRFRS